MGFLSASSLGRERGTAGSPVPSERFGTLSRAHSADSIISSLCAKAMQRLESHSRNSVYLIGFVMVQVTRLQALGLIPHLELRFLWPSIEVCEWRILMCGSRSWRLPVLSIIIFWMWPRTLLRSLAGRLSCGLSRQCVLYSPFCEGFTVNSSWDFNLWMQCFLIHEYFFANQSFDWVW